jgi:hypothetical protein
MEIIKYNEIFKRQKHLLSLSIFKIKGPYRPFEKYIRFLDRLLNHAYNNKYNFDIRVYFDDSCSKELKPIIDKYKNVEFYKFNYPPLRIGPYHNGTFGSLIRLLPIFENPTFLKTVNDHVYDYIWIDDIDILPSALDLNFVNDYGINKFNTIFLSIFCYKRPWIKDNYNMNFPLITNIKLDPKIFNKFIDDLANNRFPEVIEQILKFRPDRYKYDYPVRHPYGMDEYFTNYIIYDKLIKYNTYVIYQTDITKLLKKIIITKQIDKYNKDIINKLLELHEVSYKSEDIIIKRDINNTYIKLFNKINKENILKLLDEFDINCYNEFIDFLKRYDMKDINNFKFIIRLNQK